MSYRRRGVNVKILVQKFGGTSVATPEQRERVVHHIRHAIGQGYRLVVVVSAMGRRGDPYATDTLLQMVSKLDVRERDLLLSCGELISACVLSSVLRECDIKNCVLTGGQAGIITDNQFSNARVIETQPQRMLMELRRGNVVIVTGFQGRTLDGELTTLGRGGSDTSATAIGAALLVEYIDIFTDVDGIMTADPRIVEEAAPLKAVTYSEMCNLAFQGAKVIHPRAVEIAMQSQIPIRVRSTMTDDLGTLVADSQTSGGLDRGGQLITGITQLSNVTQIKVPAKGDQLDIHLKVFKAMADYGISVDFISINPSGIAYTVKDELSSQAEGILRNLNLEPELTLNCSKISAVGSGMTGAPGVMGTILEALIEEDIQVLQSADSHTTIWVLVRGPKMEQAVRALHRKFHLHEKV